MGYELLSAFLLQCYYNLLYSIKATLGNDLQECLKFVGILAAHYDGKVAVMNQLQL